MKIIYFITINSNLRTIRVIITIVCISLSVILRKIQEEGYLLVIYLTDLTVSNDKNCVWQKRKRHEDFSHPAMMTMLNVVA